MNFGVGFEGSCNDGAHTTFVTSIHISKSNKLVILMTQNHSLMHASITKAFSGIIMQNLSIKKKEHLSINDS